MPSLFTHSPFPGFGPAARLREEGFTGERLDADTRLRLRTAVKARCPKGPGIYGMLDENDELIYVGKAKRLRPRLLSYFRTETGNAKSRRILRRTKAIVWECLPHELAALIRELQLIRQWRPRFNVMGRPDPRKRVFLCLGRAPAPYLFLSPRVTSQCQAAWGPVPSGPRAAAAVKVLNDLCRLRDCPRPNVPMRYADQGQLFDPTLTAGCLRWEIGTCSAPCAGACTRRQYGDQTRQAQQFLEGHEDRFLMKLTEEMKTASRDQQFERAATLRDQLENLTWLRETLERGERARAELTFIYPVTAGDGQPWWFLIERGQPRAFVPVLKESSKERERLVRQVFHERPCVGGPNDGQEDRELLWLVSSWFRKYPAERERTLPITSTLAA